MSNIPNGEGQIYSRGPQGEIPMGQSINGQNGAYGMIGQPEHVSQWWDGGHHSWDNPGPTGYHPTTHQR